MPDARCPMPPRPARYGTILYCTVRTCSSARKMLNAWSRIASCPRAAPKPSTVQYPAIQAKFAPVVTRLLDKGRYNRAQSSFSYCRYPWEYNDDDDDSVSGEIDAWDSRNAIILTDRLLLLLLLRLTVARLLSAHPYIRKSHVSMVLRTYVPTYLSAAHDAADLSRIFYPRFTLMKKSPNARGISQERENGEAVVA
ncbi:hypothetical protein CIB48_g2311 [Xylaria polymorpha]|nr:hypothetical protein CIB48_g2311 [Xylaria polymorpha]